ncbi:MAG: glycosyltransferase family 4 protein [Clostridia bacterium]|nr:glycosyltransferase family 4 protein [Clostridia bacterium]
MRVFHIITDTNIGGAGRLLLAVLNNIDKGMFDVSVCVPKNSALVPLIEETGVRVIPTEHGQDKSYEPAAVHELIRIIKSENPDIVHTHASLSGRLAARRCRVPIRIMTRHCAFGNKKSAERFPIKQLRGAFSDMLTTHYVATAEIAKRQLVAAGCSEKKITVIQNGAEKMRDVTDSERAALRSTLGIPDGAFVVGISARLEEYKGHKYLIDAMNRIRDSVNDVYLIVVGDGKMRLELECYANEKGVSDRVVFTGFQPDMAPYYSIFDVGANCSYGAETTPLAITEAMSVGVPSVVTDSGGNSDTVTDGYDGLVVPEKDADALAAAILSLYSNRDLLARLGESARRSYDEKFSAEIMTEKLEKLYLTLAERKGIK